MPILFDSGKKIFKLDTKGSSYLFAVNEDGILVHTYYGAPIEECDLGYLNENFTTPGICPKPHYAPGGKFTLDTAPVEFPCTGTGDYRPAAFSVRSAQGHTATLVHYLSHKIYGGKPALEGLPATFAKEDEATTLEILTEDRHTGLRVTLFYTVFEHLSAMTRHVVVENPSDRAVNIERIYSTSVDFHTHEYDVIHLHGHHCRERSFSRTRLDYATHRISSLRGASGAEHNPFMALVSPDATEEHGEAYGFNLVYSGNFAAEVNVECYGSARVAMGINADGFNWLLAPGERFTAPEAVMVYSDEGLGGMSRTFHKLYMKHLMRGEWLTKHRPVLINNWEATAMNFDGEKLYEFAKKASELGIEMLVLDDGWFGKRNNARCALGDWVVNEEKLGGTMNDLVKRINGLGMKFGLWFEPEMVSPDSDLYRAHPDWCLHIDGRPMSLGRYQLILDLTRKEVEDYVFDSMCRVLDSANIEYVKWDFNRNFTEAGSVALPAERQKEVPHRYMLALYRLLERLVSRYPHLLLEGCASGGGRFDPGMLYYSPQIWTSDCSDAIERLDIQYGTTMCYPPSSMGAHVSASPNHQTKRISPLTTRGNVALEGTFGYELDPATFTEEECEIVRTQVKQYHELYHLTHFGELYRLVGPFDSDRERSAWMQVTEDKREALVTLVIIRTHVGQRQYLRLRGLDAKKKYRDVATNKVYSGALLMNAGLCLNPLTGDGASRLIHLVAED